jgi:membrane-associated PAP2 superfamily phosphatase
MKNTAKHIFFSRDIYIPVILLLVFSLPFYFWDIDISVSKWFYSSFPGNHWPLTHKQPWDFLYNFGTWPALGIAFIALLVTISCFFNKKILQYRKRAIYLVTVMIIGPGLLVNVIFKDNFGRPRPGDIVEFGGEQQYHQLLKPDWGNPGKSFPSGHCSCAFYFFVLYFLFKGNKRKWLPYAGLSIGIGYGILMGIARIGQGGHFLSDVMWSAGFVYLTAGGVYYVMYGDPETAIPSPS